ncbi:NupC/NupG family nucleoside CNT transporter [Pradoshia sp. D12]|uniref:NupC/NupG family nucleoside CNT transporter n=1 Tax=Bacillaceae TaxID=186817 RepID=UPI00080ADF7D|nr:MULTISPECIES: nucleoside transporter C-terminal domain-containing protein [Bacillaceae]OCA90168.1 pyrimidine nucleoside transporter NupC [Bacillus sp. FJAT-27986]QFK70424.1 NupC/NupG family nucleoside CNT transporter [Pradoshia sp. D12]TPF72219.1 NupC/NupG family nucleoside CNT transporter [Bacillus sp. D12]
MSIILGILGIALLIGISYLFSNDKKNINFKAVAIMIGFQLVLTFLLLGTTVGLKVVDAVAGAFNKLLSYSQEGIEFVIGGWIPEGGSPFFVNVLMPVIFTSALLSVLTHYKILPYIIKYIGGLISKITGLPQVESFNAVNSIFFGQSEAILAIKSQIGKLNSNRLFIVSTSAMASVSAALIASYMTMLPAKFVLIAIFLNMFSALIITSIMTPVKATKEDTEIDINDMVQTKNVFEAIGAGALDGGKVVVIVAVMLVAYLAILGLLNGIVGGIVGVDLTTIVGYLLSPIAFIMGIPASEMITAGSVMGTKLLANEFAAILQFQPLMADMSEKAVAVISTFLISFANFSSIGIISGSIQAINGAKAKEVSAFGFKLFIVATMASILSATIVGLFI